MAILFTDSYDHYTTLLDKYVTLQGSPSIGAFGRNGTNGLRSTAQANYPVANLGANAATLIAGYAVNTSGLAGNRAICQFLDNLTAQVTCVLNTNGSVTVLRGTAAGTALGTSSVGIVPIDGSYPYLEFKVLVNNTTGTFELRVNGVSVYTLTAQDTQNTVNAFANQWAPGSTGSVTAQIDVDDVVILDTTGTPNDFLGDRRVTALLPSGAGDSAQFTPSAGSNFQNVDETAPDGDATYNESGTVGHEDFFAMGDLTGPSGTVSAVVLWYHHRKTDAGTRTVRGKVKHSTTEGDGATVSPGLGYGYTRDVFTTNPSTAAAWTPTEVNAMQAGYEVVT